MTTHPPTPPSRSSHRTRSGMRQCVRAKTAPAASHPPVRWLVVDACSTAQHVRSFTLRPWCGLIARLQRTRHRVAVVVGWACEACGAAPPKRALGRLDVLFFVTVHRPVPSLPTSPSSTTRTGRNCLGRSMPSAPRTAMRRSRGRASCRPAFRRPRRVSPSAPRISTSSGSASPSLCRRSGCRHLHTRTRISRPSRRSARRAIEAGGLHSRSRARRWRPECDPVGLVVVSFECQRGKSSRRDVRAAGRESRNALFGGPRHPA